MTTELPADLDVLQRLYSVPPPEFVEARTALVKERRAAKDRAGAIAIAALRRPSVVDWVLNVVAGAHPTVVEAFADAAERVREAQAAAIEGRAGADVRVALRELREHSGKVLAAARRAVAQTGRPADSQTAELSARLAELAGSTGATSQLRAGLLGLPRPDDDDDPFAGLEPAARQPRAAAAGRARPAGRTARSSGSEATPAADWREVGSDAERAAARRRARAELTAAQRDERAAAKAVATAERGAATERRAVDEARSRLDGAERRLEEAEAELAEAGRGLAEARAAIESARRAVAEAG